MKRSLLLFALFAFGILNAGAQVIDVSVETVYTDDASITGYPTGYSTYRIWANCTNPNDRVASISGNDDAPLILTLDGAGIWNHPLGGVVGNFASCNTINTIPVVGYDSYVTLDYTCNDGSTNTVYSVEDVAQPWKTQLFNTSPLGGASMTLNTSIGGGWFGIPSVVDPDNDQTRAGDDLKVLIAQITTDGNICGIFNIQCFPDYDDLNDEYILQTGFQFGSTDCGVPGCTDQTALNYNALAEFENGLCLYECAIDFEEITLVDPTCSYNMDGSVYFVGNGAQDYIRYYYNGDLLGENGLSPQIVEGLGNGIYSVTIEDTRFDNESFNPGGFFGTCSVTQDVELFTPEIFMDGITSSDVSCAQDANGCASLEIAEGGTGDLTFMIHDDNDEPVLDGEGNVLELAGPSYCGLYGGTFTFVATDENGCEASSSSFDIFEPGEIALFEGAELAASCFNSADGQQVLTFTGGTGDIDFDLDGDDVYDIEGGDFNLILDALTPGAYTVYAADENGCIGELAFEVAGGPAITTGSEVAMPLCNGDSNGSITLTASGGTGDFTYSFDGVTYTTDPTMMDVAADTYMAYAMDENECVAEFEVLVQQPDVLNATASGDDILCNGETNGTVTISAEGGTEPYAFSLDGVDYLPNPMFTGLGADTYDAYVTDSNGCEFTLSGAAVVSEPEALGGSAAAADVLCNGDNNGSITVNAVGGTSPYQYSTGGAFSSANPITGLDANTYTVTVMDNSGCEFVISNVAVDEPAEIQIQNLSNDNINSDPGGNTPYDVIGGVQPYDYSWEDSDGNVVTTSEDLPDFTSASDAGTYTLTITDANGCEVSQSITITGVNELGIAYEINIYPNPSNGLFIVNLNGLGGSKTTYTVSDQAGRIVTAKELGNVAGSRTENVDLTFCAAGIYYMTFVIGDQTQSAKLIIE
ncbi:MAG: T9SS type A sorting domain-containing protein [Flavobacteriales bacterium]